MCQIQFLPKFGIFVKKKLPNLSYFIYLALQTCDLNTVEMDVNEYLKQYETAVPVNRHDKIPPKNYVLFNTLFLILKWSQFCSNLGACVSISSLLLSIMYLGFYFAMDLWLSC